MEKSSKRGKIPQQDWPSIIERYESGETLASIARTYDCSPPAISYIVSRSRARNAEAGPAEPGPAAAAPETQLVKARPTEAVSEPLSSETAFGPAVGDSPPPMPESAGGQHAASPDAPSDHTPPPEPTPLRPSSPAQLPAFLRDPPKLAGNGTAERPGQIRREPGPIGNGSAGRPSGFASPPPNNEPRGRLHLLRPQSEGPSDPKPPRPSQNTGFAQADDRFDRRPAAAPPPRSQPAYPPAAPPPRPSQYPRSANGPLLETERGAEGASFIGRTLRERVDGDIAAFLAAFDAALDHDTLESRAGLREATDRLLRAGARTRIELERLEARVPLTPRDRTGQPPVLRQR